ncbi:MAG: T9SS type A sorting domain-containing protein [Ignavibacteria bacterium]|nr:T9SS type A sorting domain-containing protein [Ignavibacteria bacterium]
MKKIILTLLFVLIVQSVFSQSADLTITQTNDGTNIDVSIFIKRTGGVAWNMGNGSYVFNFNLAAVNISGATIVTKGQWDVATNTNYAAMYTANYGPGIARSLETEININPGADVPTSNTLVGILRLPITNSSANHNITWNAPFSAVQTDAGTDVTLNFINPTNSQLPVELAGFTSAISKNEVTLQWETTMEQNNSGFQVQRMKTASSGTTEQWKDVTFVSGKGNSNETNEYATHDRNLNSGEYKYRLKQIDYNGNYHYYELEHSVTVEKPKSYRLAQNYPNPFNPSTTICFDLPNDGKVGVMIYDITGRVISQLMNEYKEAGYYAVDFNASNFASGIYYYSIVAGENKFIATKKMVLIK